MLVGSIANAVAGTITPAPTRLAEATIAKARRINAGLDRDMTCSLPSTPDRRELEPDAESRGGSAVIDHGSLPSTPWGYLVGARERRTVQKSRNGLVRLRA